MTFGIPGFYAREIRTRNAEWVRRAIHEGLPPELGTGNSYKMGEHEYTTEICYRGRCVGAYTLNELPCGAATGMLTLGANFEAIAGGIAGDYVLERIESKLQEIAESANQSRN